MNELKEQSSNNETHLKKQILHTEYEKCYSILVQTQKIIESQNSINKKQQLLKEKELKN